MNNNFKKRKRKEASADISMHDTFECHYLVSELPQCASFQHWLFWWVYLSFSHSSAQSVCFLTSCGSHGLSLFLVLSGAQRFTQSLVPMHATTDIWSHQPSKACSYSECCHWHTLCLFSSQTHCAHCSPSLTDWLVGTQGLLSRDTAGYILYFHVPWKDQT